MAKIFEDEFEASTVATVTSPTAVASTKDVHVKSIAPEMPPNSGRCLLLELPVELLKEVASHLFPLWSNGRPARWAPMQGHLRNRNKTATSFAVLLTCRQLFHIAHLTAYTTIDWNVLCGGLWGSVQHHLCRQLYVAFLKTFTPTNLANFHFIRGAGPDLQAFMEVRDASFQQIKDEQLRIEVVGSTYEHGNMTLIMTNTHFANLNGWAFNKQLAEKAVEQGRAILMKWPGLQQLDLLLQAPQFHERLQVQPGMAESFQKSNAELEQWLVQIGKDLDVDVKCDSGGLYTGNLKLTSPNGRPKKRVET